MSYKALLFCPDEKTARTVTQVLSELDFSVEASSEPFAAVKKLTSEHFDALVVDGENQQNASLLFKTARNSGSNQTSLAVAIVEGQSGVAKAFQIGANLVLTKPINVEQSKGTLRVARGLLRKNEATKGVATTHASEHTLETHVSNVETKPARIPEQTAAPVPPASFTVPQPSFAAASPTSLFEVEEEPSPAPEPTEAALLESMPDLTTGKIGKADLPSAPVAPKSSPWQPTAQPMAQPVATALQHADQALGISSASLPSVTAERSVSSHASTGAAAAAAPAREPNFKSTEIEEEIASPELPELPKTAAHSGTPTALIAAAVVIIAFAAGYFGWTRIQWRSGASSRGASPARIAAPATAVPASPSSAEPYSATVVATPLPRNASISSPNPEAPSQSTKKIASISVSDADKSASGAHKQDVLVVNSEPAKPSIPPVIAQVDAEPAPAPSIVSSGSGDSAVSGLVEMPASTPQAAPHTLRVSQGVSQGLLVKKVAPEYPQRALAMRVQGAVQLLATISPEGNVTNVKLLSGDALLARAAMDAVKQWKYKPYYLDDKPLEIQTEITVNFKAPQQ